MVQQLDIEGAIAASLPTAREFAVENGPKIGRVYYSIRVGALLVDRSMRLLRIKGGEMALTVDEWQRELRSALAGEVGNYGFDNHRRQLFVLVGTDVHLFRVVWTRRETREQTAMIEHLLAPKRNRDAHAAR